MANRMDSGDEDPILPLRLSRLPHGNPDEHTTELFRERSAPANHTSHPTTPRTDEKDDLELALRLSLLPSDDFDEQIARLQHTESALTSEKARSPTPPNESEENDLELALNLSQLPADIFDEQVRGLNERRESRSATEGSPAPLSTAMSLVEVRTTHSLYLTKSLKIVLERHARRFQGPAGLGFERRHSPA
jgi:hypothetical protein